jgi:Spy/CpxP family protein refolding chaperone
MQRSKQQALMFLLGAVLVGGALGFSADRMLADKPKTLAPRVNFYDKLELTQAQRTRMDSLLDEQSCRIGAVMNPIRPHLDSIKAGAHQHMLQILTPEQQGRLELIRKEEVRRDSLRKARRDSIAARSPIACRAIN